MPRSARVRPDEAPSRYIWPFVAVAAALLLRVGLVNGLGLTMPTFITFYPAVMVVALLGGFWPGIAATGLTALATDYFVMQPRGSFSVSDLSDGVALTLFIGMGVFMSAVAERYRREQGRKRVEAEHLRQSEMMRASFDAIIVVRPDGSAESWNWGAENLYGYKAGEAIGRDVHELLKSTPARPWPDILAQLREKSRWECELRQATKEGGELVVSSRYQLMTDSDGNKRILEINRDITESKRANEALRASEELYHALFNSMAEGFCIIEVMLDADDRPVDYRFLSANAAFEKQTGMRNVVGRRIRELVPSVEEFWIEIYGKVALTGEPTHFLNEVKELNRFCEVSAYRVGEPGLRQVAFVLNDISESKRAARNIERLNRVYSVLSDTNQTIVREKDTQAMLQTVCDIAVEKGGFRMAWVGMYDAATETLRPVVWSGAGEDYLDATKFDFRYPENRGGPAAHCVFSNEHAICNDIERDPDYAMWREAALRLGYRSSGGFPLRREGEVIGVFSIYSTEPEFFDDKETALLDEMAMDISHALEVSRIETARRASEEELQEHLKTLEESQIIGNIGNYVLDIPARRWTSSPVMDEIFGIDKAYERTVEGWLALVHPEDREMMAEYLAREVVGKRVPFDKEYRIVRPPDGTQRWLHGMGRLEQDSDGKLLKMTGVIRDITEQKQTIDSLRESNELYASVFQTSPDFVAITSMSDGRYIEANKELLDTLGFTREELIGKTSAELNIWVNDSDRQKMIEAALKDTVCRNMEFEMRKKNGETLWVLISASTFTMKGVPYLYSITRDISETKIAEGKIKHLAFFDALTGLPNRSLLLDRLSQALAVSTRSRMMHAMLFIDLDNFKLLNDRHGHHIGDLQLQEVARRLTACVRECDTVARLGGDEFVVLLEELSQTPEETAARVGAVGAKILTVLREPYLLVGHEHRSTASIGINVFGNQQETTNDVLKQADIAMYQAKLAGRDTMRFFAPELQSAIESRAVLEQEVREAIRGDQFVLYYQPQMEGGRVVGAEALIRWKHPVRGIVAPGEFIALAEETGLILPLGNWVLETSCEQIAAWAQRKETRHVVVAVNISARQFRQPDFVEQVVAIIERTGAPPERLKLELTESLLVDNIEEVVAKMTSLKAHGVTFSVDDFGTGYSSLTYLQRLPLDQLKIDRSFVCDIITNVGSSAIASAVISMGRAMGMSVIAEGVETEEQRECLARMGCTAYQGYLFSRPVPPAEFDQVVMLTAR